MLFFMSIQYEIRFRRKSAGIDFSSQDHQQTSKQMPLIWKRLTQQGPLFPLKTIPRAAAQSQDEPADHRGQL